VAAVTLVLGETTEVDCGTADTVRLIELPANAKRVRATARTVASKLIEQTSTGTIVLADAAAIGTTDYQTLPPNTPIEIDVPGTQGTSRQLVAALRRLWVSSSTANAIVELRAL
jgi:hypothetical protein